MGDLSSSRNKKNGNNARFLRALFPDNFLKIVGFPFQRNRNLTATLGKHKLILLFFYIIALAKSTKIPKIMLINASEEIRF